jgi:hypothetical protein
LFFAALGFELRAFYHLNHTTSPREGVILAQGDIAHVRQSSDLNSKALAVTYYTDGLLGFCPSLALNLNLAARIREGKNRWMSADLLRGVGLNRRRCVLTGMFHLGRFWISIPNTRRGSSLGTVLSPTE